MLVSLQRKLFIYQILTNIIVTWGLLTTTAAEIYLLCTHQYLFGSITFVITKCAVVVFRVVVRNAFIRYTNQAFLYLAARELFFTCASVSLAVFMFSTRHHQDSNYLASTIIAWILLASTPLYAVGFVYSLFIRKEYRSYMENQECLRRQQRAESNAKNGEAAFWSPTSVDPDSILRPMSPTIASISTIDASGQLPTTFNDILRSDETPQVDSIANTIH